MAGGGGRVEGRGEALENGSPVVVMLVPERMLSETWGAGARENMCSRETEGTAALRSREGSRFLCTISSWLGGKLVGGVLRVSLVHEGGGVANAGEPGGVEMSAGSVTEGTCGEARGAR